MLRLIKLIILVVLVVGFVILAMANRDMVTVNLLPPDLARLAGLTYAAEVPLFFVGLGGVALGLLVGFIWEWLRESRHRAEVAKRQREVKALKSQVIKLKGERDKGKDEVLALLEDPPRKSV